MKILFNEYPTPSIITFYNDPYLLMKTCLPLSLSLTEEYEIVKKSIGVGALLLIIAPGLTLIYVRAGLLRIEQRYCGKKVSITI